MRGRESGMPGEGYWDSFFNPACILEKLDCVGPLNNVVDFGCGYGLFTVAAARLVAGHILGLDIDARMVEVTTAKARAAGLSNVAAEQRDFIEQGCGLPDGSVGYAMLFNILHVEDPVGLMKEARRVLAPGGKLGVIHWKHDPGTPRGPSLAIRPRPEQCRAWGEEAGLEFVRHEPLRCCSWHYGLVMRRPASSRA